MPCFAGIPVGVLPQRRGADFTGSYTTPASPKPDSLLTQRFSHMKFADFILTGSVKAEVQASDKQGAIRELVRSLVDAGGIKKDDCDGIVKAIIKREELGSTGIGRGIAVPHTKHSCVDRLVGTVAVSREGIDFDSLDCEKVNLFFLLISPPDAPGDHLRALEHITRQLKDDSFCRFLKQSDTQDKILDLLKEADANVYVK
ncbi:MAG: PTS sugar transporter subunit IIA [Planctomycetaceae bacterium]|nr:PTS sugar transporter subunit IIA [Planctomycetaceae bacterium]